MIFRWKRRLAMAACAVVGLVVGGCGVLIPRPTATPLVVFVTATTQAATAAPTPANTDVVGPTQDAILPTLPTATITPTGTDPLAILPTLPPATKTPLPTSRATLTPSFTPTFTESPMPSGTAVKCTGATAQGGFATILSKDKALQRSLGCPLTAAMPIDSASQPFDGGTMLWASMPTRSIYVLYNNGTYQRYDDTWVEKVDPDSTGETAPAGKFAPIRGFGKVWHNNPPVKNGLGWATATEAGTPGQIQHFVNGDMLFVATLGKTYILISGSTSIWRIDPTVF